jgi:hypothetical protein
MGIQAEDAEPSLAIGSAFGMRWSTARTPCRCCGFSAWDGAVHVINVELACGGQGGTSRRQPKNIPVADGLSGLLGHLTTVKLQ